MTRDQEITDKYVGGLSAAELSTTYGLTPRQVQRIVKKAGVSRTISESYTLAIKTGRMTYHKTPEHLKKHRKRLSDKLRFRVLARDNYTCVLCGMTAKDGYRIEVDHIDDDPSHNTIDNLQTLCARCNKGKARM